MTHKEVINKIACELYEAGVDIGRQLTVKDAEVSRRIQEKRTVCGCGKLTEAQLDEIEFAVFEENSRDTWMLKARGGAIAHVFNQDVE